MWFRNLRLYRLVEPFTLSPEALGERLAGQPFRECGRLEPETMGWVAPVDEEVLTHAADGRVLIRARFQERILPASVVREEVAARVEAMEERSGDRVSRAQRTDLRDQVVQELLPRAFTRSTDVAAYLAPSEGWLVVDTASDRRAEALTELLRRSLGSLPIAPPRVLQAPGAVMTGWLRGEGLPAEAQLGDECELRDPGEDGGIVRCRRQDLAAEEVAAHLIAGKQAVRLALEWDERLSFVLGEDLSLRRLRFADVVQEAVSEIDAEDRRAVLDAEFALMTLELARLLPRLLEVFGGEDAESYAAGALRAA